MTHMPQISRRLFITSVAAAGGGLTLGLRLPEGIGSAAARSPTTLSAWASP